MEPALLTGGVKASITGTFVRNYFELFLGLWFHLSVHGFSLQIIQLVILFYLICRAL